MASELRRLKDEDLEQVHHLLRRDSLSDAEIAAEAERLAGKKLWATAGAGQRAVSRYRAGAAFKGWLKRWENQDHELKAKIETQKQRFELLTKLVSGSDKTGFETVPRAILARVLAASAEMDDAALLGAMEGKGPVATAIRLVRDLMSAEKRTQAKQAENAAGDDSLDEIERRRRIREIFKAKAEGGNLKPESGEAR